jgi:ribonuclease P protein component
LKRRLREVLRTEVLPEMPAVDLILRAAPRAYELPFESIREEVGAALRRLPALKPE